MVDSVQTHTILVPSPKFTKKLTFWLSLWQNEGIHSGAFSNLAEPKDKVAHLPAEDIHFYQAFPNSSFLIYLSACEY